MQSAKLTRKPPRCVTLSTFSTTSIWRISPRYGGAAAWWPLGFSTLRPFRCSSSLPSSAIPGACRIRAKGAGRLWPRLSRPRRRRCWRRRFMSALAFEANRISQTSFCLRCDFSLVVTSRKNPGTESRAQASTAQQLGSSSNEHESRGNPLRAGTMRHDNFWVHGRLDEAQADTGASESGTGEFPLEAVCGYRIRGKRHRHGDFPQEPRRRAAQVYEGSHRPETVGLAEGEDLLRQRRLPRPRSLQTASRADRPSGQGPRDSRQQVLLSCGCAAIFLGDRGPTRPRQSHETRKRPLDAGHRRKAVRSRPVVGEATQLRSEEGSQRETDLPHRPLPRQGNGPECDGLPLHEQHYRAAVESELCRPCADYRGRNRGRGASRRVL